MPPPCSGSLPDVELVEGSAGGEPALDVALPHALVGLVAEARHGPGVSIISRSSRCRICDVASPDRCNSRQISGTQVPVGLQLARRVPGLIRFSPTASSPPRSPGYGEGLQERLRRDALSNTPAMRTRAVVSNIMTS